MGMSAKVKTRTNLERFTEFRFFDRLCLICETVLVYQLSKFFVYVHVRFLENDYPKITGERCYHYHLERFESHLLVINHSKMKNPSN